MFYDVPPTGSGFNADQLHEASLRNLWNKLKDENPALLQESREVMKQSIKAARASVDMKTRLAQTLGTDAVKLALEALTKDAEAVIRAEEATEAQAREAAAIEARKAAAHPVLVDPGLVGKTSQPAQKQSPQKR
jgi:hypothetical protein